MRVARNAGSKMTNSQTKDGGRSAVRLELNRLREKLQSRAKLKKAGLPVSVSNVKLGKGKRKFLRNRLRFPTKHYYPSLINLASWNKKDLKTWARVTNSVDEWHAWNWFLDGMSVKEISTKLFTVPREIRIILALFAAKELQPLVERKGKRIWLRNDAYPKDFYAGQYPAHYWINKQKPKPWTKRHSFVLEQLLKRGRTPQECSHLMGRRIKTLKKWRRILKKRNG